MMEESFRCPLLACRFLLVSVTFGCEPTNQLWFCDLHALPKNEATGAIDFSSYDRSKASHKPLPLVKFIDSFHASYEYVANEVRNILFVSSSPFPVVPSTRQSRISSMCRAQASQSSPTSTLLSTGEKIASVVMSCRLVYMSCDLAPANAAGWFALT